MIDTYAVVKKLIGEIEPAGETDTDKKRLENLKQQLELISALLDDLQSIRHHKDRAEYSIKRIGKEADDFLTDYFNNDRSI